MYRGRINRATYWLSIGILVGLYAAAYVLTSKPAHVTEILLILLAVPRLHDIGKSGWWAGGLFLAEIIIAIGAFAMLSMNVAIIAVGLFVIVAAGLLIWLGLLPGEPDANRFGEPPLPGLAFRRAKKSSPEDHFS